ncbi:hypothetical protein HWV62_19139 [Athelia sp. TMB]|nr:hypothetical protein HWV62_19139 [Athelia sp. TMB]
MQAPAVPPSSSLSSIAASWAALEVAEQELEAKKVEVKHKKLNKAYAKLRARSNVVTKRIFTANSPPSPQPTFTGLVGSFGLHGGPNDPVAPEIESRLQLLQKAVQEYQTSPPSSFNKEALIPVPPSRAATSPLSDLPPEYLSPHRDRLPSPASSTSSRRLPYFDSDEDKQLPTLQLPPWTPAEIEEAQHELLTRLKHARMTFSYYRLAAEAESDAITQTELFEETENKEEEVQRAEEAIERWNQDHPTASLAIPPDSDTESLKFPASDEEEEEEEGAVIGRGMKRLRDNVSSDEDQNGRKGSGDDEDNSLGVDGDTKEPWEDDEEWGGIVQEWPEVSEDLDEDPETSPMCPLPPTRPPPSKKQKVTMTKAPTTSKPKPKNLNGGAAKKLKPPPLSKEEFANTKNYRREIIEQGMESVVAALRTTCYKHHKQHRGSAKDREHGSLGPPGERDADCDMTGRLTGCGCLTETHVLDILAFKDPAEDSDDEEALDDPEAFRTGTVNQRKAYIRLIENITHTRFPAMVQPSAARTLDVANGTLHHLTNKDLSLTQRVGLQGLRILSSDADQIERELTNARQ